MGTIDHDDTAEERATRGVSRSWTRLLSSPVGVMQAEATGRGLCGLRFIEPLRRPRGEPGRIHPTEFGACTGEQGTIPSEVGDVFDRLESEVIEYFEGKRTVFGVPMDLGGTVFQRLVWSALVQVPFGSTRGYARLAADIGKPLAVRAVARCNAQNPVTILVPCHRVIGSDGGLTGYAGGLARKQWLLDFERSVRGEPALFA